MLRFTCSWHVTQPVEVSASWCPAGFHPLVSTETFAMFVVRYSARAELHSVAVIANAGGNDEASIMRATMLSSTKAMIRAATVGTT